MRNPEEKNGEDLEQPIYSRLPFHDGTQKRMGRGRGWRNGNEVEQEGCGGQQRHRWRWNSIGTRIRSWCCWAIPLWNSLLAHNWGPRKQQQQAQQQQKKKCPAAVSGLYRHSIRSALFLASSLALHSLLLCLFAILCLLHLLHRRPRPSAYFALAIGTTTWLLAAGCALFAVLRPKQKRAALRLRPLLFLTWLSPLLGLPLLWLPPPLCWWPTTGPQCSPNPLPIVVLALVVASGAPLRTLLQNGLLRARQRALLAQLCRWPLSSATFFNHFCCRMRATAESQEEIELLECWEKSGFGHDLKAALEECIRLESSKERSAQIEVGEAGQHKSRPTGLLAKQNSRHRRHRQQQQPSKREVHFSQLLLLREISSVQNELGQLVQMDRHKKFVLESLYADFVRDFRLRLTPQGRLKADTIRQVFTRFGPVETLSYTKVTTSDGYYDGSAGGGSGENRRRTTKVQEGRRRRPVPTKRKRLSASGEGQRRKVPLDRDYATIDSASEANPFFGSTSRKAFALQQQPLPVVPSTPIPQTTPTDPMGPQSSEVAIRLATIPTGRSGSTSLYENLATLALQQSAGHGLWNSRSASTGTDRSSSRIISISRPLEQQGNDERKRRMTAAIFERKMEDKDEKEEAETEEDEKGKTDEGENEEREQRGQGKQQQKQQPQQGWCSCPLGADCLVVSARATSHYYLLSGRLEVLQEEEME